MPKTSIGCSFLKTQHYSWRSKQKESKAQIDLIIERADKIINLCEMKYCQGKYLLTKEESEKLQNRISVFRSETGVTYPIWLTMITTNGLAKSVYNSNIIKELTLNDLFE